MTASYTEIYAVKGDALPMEDQQPQQTSSDKEAKKMQKLNTTHAGENDTEFADELTSKDIKSAFKNPITGEERLY